MCFKLKYSQYNSHSILIEWPSEINEKILHDIIKFKNKIAISFIKEKVELIYAYNSILVIYKSTIDNVNDAFSALKECYLENNNVGDLTFTTWDIPVCYDAEFSDDLEAFSKVKKLSKPEIISIHSETFYTVYFIGFLPGFLYLGGLDSRLFLDRKTTPNLNVKKGSVAIGGQQTGIYPQNSPGGWHIIGNSPIDLFNASQNPPCVINTGDKIKFTSVSKYEYLEILALVNASEYELKAYKTDA